MCMSFIRGFAGTNPRPDNEPFIYIYILFIFIFALMLSGSLVNMAWRVSGLTWRRRPADMRVAANMLNIQSCGIENR
jgi:hypothetical protein